LDCHRPPTSRWALVVLNWPSLVLATNHYTLTLKCKIYRNARYCHRGCFGRACNAHDVLGAHLSLHPADSTRKTEPLQDHIYRMRVVSVGLVAWQAWRNTNAGAVIEGRLTHIEQNTKEPPRVQVTVQPTPVIVQRQTGTTSAPEVAESPCANPLMKFSQETFRTKIPEAPDVVHGVRGFVPTDGSLSQLPALFAFGPITSSVHLARHHRGSMIDQNTNMWIS